MKTRFIAILAFFAISTLGYSQKSFWTPVPSTVTVTRSGDWNQISNLKLYQLDHKAFRNFLLTNIPPESAQAKAVPVSLPMPDGSFRTFNITESAVMETGLALKFPEIKTYKGSDGSNYMRMCISPYGFNAYILSEQGDIIIEALNPKDISRYGVFRSTDIKLTEPLALSCGTLELSNISIPKASELKAALKPRTGNVILGTPVDLKSYRVAIACTGEWGGASNLGGGSIPTAINKIVAALVYINAVYEKDFAVHLNLIATNDRLIYLDGATDPYPFPRSGGQTLGINTEVINAKVGPAAYDIGHVFTASCTDVGGIASLNCVCNANKGNGVTCWYTSDIPYVSQRITCHEMGHQFAANHTFSNCNGNEAGTSYEPGSGTTIMSYSGLCGPLNVEPDTGRHPDYFHVNSLETVIANTRRYDASRCGTITPTTNTYPEPEILIPSGLYIPIRTPFMLRGRATDMENDFLTYTWEQYDAGGYGPSIGEPLLTIEGPLFKSLFPRANPNREVPNWNAIFYNANFEKTEVLPVVSREINFRYTVRDNHAGAGGAAWKQTFFRSLESAGPFAVNFPNTTATDTLYAGVCNTVSWDVANTDQSLVNCKKVNIYLMPNKANPNTRIPLVLNTDNDGKELVDIPDSLANRNFSRLMVEAADNIFFDVSDQDIRIRRSSNPKLFFGVAPNYFKFCVPSQADVAVRSCAANLNGNLSLFIESGLPDNARFSFSNSNPDVNGQSNLHLDFADVRVSGIYQLVVAAVTPQGDTVREQITMDLVSVDFSDLKTIYPADGLSGLSQSIQFQWSLSVNALNYTIEIATSPLFGSTTVYTQGGITGNTFKPNFLFDEKKLYYWRVIPNNRCGLGSPTTPSPFHTVNKACVETEYPGNVLTRKPNQMGVMTTPIRDAGIINDVNIRNFKASANFIFNVTLNMVSPLGTRVKLFDKNCGNTGEFNCSFDDDGTYTLNGSSSACPPINSKLIKPLEALSKFNGEDKKGDWRLEVFCDQGAAGFSDFYSYTLDICSELIINDPFLVINKDLLLDKGETKGIGPDLLQSQDVDNGPAELIYTLMSECSHGDLLINGVRVTTGMKFSQKDIDDGKLSYHHTGQGQEIDGFLFVVEDPNGGWFGSDLFRILIGTVATRDEAVKPEFSIFPNPTTGLLQIASDRVLEKNASLKLMNLQGQELIRKALGNQKAEVLNLLEFPAGVYILQINSGKYHSAYKVVLEK